MTFENTMTEQDMDAQSQQFIQEFRADAGAEAPDLVVEVLSESMLSRLLGLFGIGKA